MALLTDEQLHQIRELIRSHHSAFIVNTIGPEAVAPAVLEQLNERGMVDVEIETIEDAYLYGHALAAANNPTVANMSLNEFRQWVKRNPIPLTDQERRAIDFAKHQAAQYAVGLGNKIDTQTGQILIEADRQLEQQRRSEIQTATASAIAERKSVKELVSDLKWKTKDWARDWDRIAITEKHNAMQHGMADHYIKRYGDDVRVAKRPTPSACQHCKRLHLGPDGQPRIFKLRDLEQNGTNYGRKARDWLPVVGATHPNCMCQMVRIPEGWGFDENGDLFPGGEYGVSYEGPEDLALAMQQEDELLKAHKLQGHTEFQGIPIAIENRKGSVRRWTNAEGEKGETRMLYRYGFIERTEGADGDELDVYVGDNGVASNAFIVNQISPSTGLYDESKIFLGFNSPAKAKQAYLDHVDNSSMFGWMVSLPVDHLKRWLLDSNTFQSVVDRSPVNAKMASNLGDRCAFLVKGKHFVSVEEASSLVVTSITSGGETSPAKSIVDSVWTRAQPTFYLGDGMSLLPEGEGFIKSPCPRYPVDASMIGLGHHLKIGGMVVKSVPVAVMDNFLGAEWATENALHNHSVLKSLAAIHVDKAILCVPTEIADVAFGHQKHPTSPVRHELKFTLPIKSVQPDMFVMRKAGQVDTAAMLRGTLGIARAAMPQIVSDAMPQFIKELQRDGVSVHMGKSVVSKLKATQSELKPDKIVAMASGALKKDLRKPILVSSDSHILDGHHRWATLFHQDPNNTIDVVHVGLPMRELLKVARQFDLVEFRKAVLTSRGPSLGSSGTLATEVGAASSRAAFRSPGHGTALNIIDGHERTAPPINQDVIGYDPGSSKDVEGNRVYLDPDQYIIPTGPRQKPRRYEVYDQSYFREPEVEIVGVRRTPMVDKEPSDDRGPLINAGHTSDIQTMLEAQDWDPRESLGIDAKTLLEKDPDAEDTYSSLTQVRDRPVYTIPEGLAPYTDEGHRATERAERKRLEEQELRNRQRPRNTVDVEDR